MPTGIEWCDEVWNFIAGCTRASAGCDNCYAATMTRRLEAMGLPQYQGLSVRTKDGRDAFNGQVRLLEDRLAIPFGWRKPRRIFPCSRSDMFHKDVPFEFLDKAFAVMALNPHHTFMCLTKRPERMCGYFSNTDLRTERIGIEAELRSGIDRTIWHEEGGDPRWPLPLPNVWLGTTVEHQDAADYRIPILLDTPAASRWLSIEPMLGSVGLDLDENCSCPDCDGINWVVVGCESGPNHRRCKIEWVESIVQQCTNEGVAVFVKQIEIDGKVTKDITKFTKHLQRREYPNA